MDTLTTSEMECPLCLGEGKLRRTEVLDRLGVKDFARVAQLSAEEAFRLLLSKHKQDEQSVWARFESELAKRTTLIAERHKDELHVLKTSEQQQAHEIQNANRRVEDSLREVAKLQEKNHELEFQMAKVARVGKREELSFEDEVKTWAGMHISDKLSKNGDYLLAFRDPGGAPLEPRLLIDNKDKAAITEPDIKKLVRDAKERHAPVGVIVARDETQLRQVDRECRWSEEDGIWVLRTTRQWLPRDLDVLKPLFERMRAQGSDFLDKNVALAEELRRTFADIDRIDSELKKAAKAITSASALVTKYRGRLQGLCGSTAKQENPPQRQQDDGGGILQKSGA